MRLRFGRAWKSWVGPLVAKVEALVASAVREHFKDSTESDDRDLIRSHVVRVDLRVDQLAIELKAAKDGSRREWVEARVPTPMPE